MFFMGVCRLLGRLLSGWSLVLGSLWTVSVCFLWVCVGCLGGSFECSGLVPHTVEEHNGVRLSIGCFTRKSWLDWSPDVKSQLEMSKNLMVFAPFPFVVFPFPCLLLVVAE